MLPPYITQYQQLLDEKAEAVNLRTWCEIKAEKSLDEKIKFRYSAAAANMNAVVSLLNEDLRVMEMRNQLAQIQSDYHDPNKLPLLG